jgi:hypothetical protein
MEGPLKTEENKFTSTVNIQTCTADSPLAVQQAIVEIGRQLCIEIFSSATGTPQDWVSRLSLNGVLSIAEVNGDSKINLIGYEKTF